MEDKPSTSMEVNEPGSLPAKVNELKRKRSGTKCCVPFCDSHTGRNPELSFHKFPQDPKLRKAWLHWISRVDLTSESFYANFELYIGFQNFETFKAFYNFLCPACERLRYRGSNNTNSDDIKEKSGRKRMLSPEEELFLCLSRLRCGLLEKDLANRYNISVSQVSNIWLTWLDFLRTRLRAVPIWPSRQFVDETMPANLKESYPRTRVIIDCTELFLEMPSEPRCQSATFSTYKNHNTAKGLVGISPRGDIVFVSELYAGNTSDQQMTRDCGVLNLLEPGDEIMADRGFAIEGDLPSGVSLNIPPFLRNDQPQLSQQEVATRRIAKHRIHVERAIQRIKSFR